MSEELFWSETELQGELDGRERQVRDQFVVQYLIDYNSVAACIRLGFKEPYARMWGPKLMAESYVQRKLQEAINERKKEMDENPESEQSRIIEGLRREANYFGPGSSQAARVAALAHLAKLNNLGVGTGNEGISTGGVMIVPVTADPADWQKLAMASQSKLKQDASN